MHIVQNTKQFKSFYVVSAKKNFKTSLASWLLYLNKVQHKSYMARYNGGKDTLPLPTSFC